MDICTIILHLNRFIQICLDEGVFNPRTLTCTPFQVQ